MTAQVDVPIASTVQEQNRLWSTAVNRQSVYMAIHFEAPREWTFILDTAPLPEGLYIRSHVIKAVNDAAGRLEDRREIRTPSFLSPDNPGGCSVLGPFGSRERAQAVANAVHQAVQHGHVGDLDALFA